MKYFIKNIIKKVKKAEKAKKAKNILPAIALVLLLSINLCYASESQMKDTLVEIINQLQAAKLLINQAQNEQPANPRVKIHFDAWVDANKQKHQGLRQDIEAIQQALMQAVNQQTIEPRSYAPVTDDFIGDGHV